MIVLGIDPGYAIMGYGIVERNDNGVLRALDYGVLTTNAGEKLQLRLWKLYCGLKELCAKYKPDEIAVEELFYHSNQKTVIPVAEARGLVLLVAQELGIEAAEYTPLQVKMGVIGYGRAEKNQMIAMSQALLGLSKPPKPDDAADALAIAICHCNTVGSALRGYFNK